MKFNPETGNYEDDAVYEHVPALKPVPLGDAQTGEIVPADAIKKGKWFTYAFIFAIIAVTYPAIKRELEKITR